MKISEWKKMIAHLKTGRWCEAEVEGIDGYFDVTCVCHLHDICSYGKVISWRPL